MLLLLKVVFLNASGIGRGVIREKWLAWITISVFRPIRCHESLVSSSDSHFIAILAEQKVLNNNT